MREGCKLWKASPFMFPLCSGAVCSLSSQQEKSFICSISLHALSIINEICVRTYFLFCSRACLLLCCSQPCCASLYAAAESKGSQGARGGQGVVATTLLTSQASQGSVSPFPGRWKRKQFCFFIKNVTESPHTLWLLWLPCFTFLVARDLLLSQC